MEYPDYRHKYWLQDSGPHAGRYRLQIFEFGKRKKQLYLLQWNFERLEEMWAFLREYFPSSRPAETQPSHSNVSFIIEPLSQQIA